MKPRSGYRLPYARHMNEWAGPPIQVSELRQIFDRLMTHIESTQGEQVTLHEDYFYSPLASTTSSKTHETLRSAS